MLWIIVLTWVFSIFSAPSVLSAEPVLNAKTGDMIFRGSYL